MIVVNSSIVVNEIIEKKGIDFTGKSFMYEPFNNLVFDGSKFVNASLVDVHLDHSTFNGCDFQNCIIITAKCIGTNFSGAINFPFPTKEAFVFAMGEANFDENSIWIDGTPILTPDTTSTPTPGPTGTPTPSPTPSPTPEPTPTPTP